MSLFKSVSVSVLSSSFKLFLELEPQLRDIIFKFYESKYASCLKLLDEIKVSIFSYLDENDRFTIFEVINVSSCPPFFLRKTFCLTCT